MVTREIEKTIRRYTICKFIIMIALLVTTLLFILSVLVGKNQTFIIIAYLMMMLIVVIAYAFPLNRKLFKNVDIDDYFVILDYLESIPENMWEQIYYDGLVMIKNSLDEIAHYKLGKAERYFADNIYYLQGRFYLPHNNNSIPKILYNRKYIRELCVELKCQIENKIFNVGRLEAIQCKDEKREHKKFYIEPQDICNIILFGLVMYKIIFSVNTKAYEFMNNSIAHRVIYNVGADIIAVAIVIITILYKKRERLN